MMFRYHFILLFLCVGLCGFAQKVKKVEAEYTYVASRNVTLEQAYHIALERAQIQAIADEFGTIVSQSNLSFIKNENGNSTVDFQSIGSSDVKGEWIETIGEPKFEHGISEDGQIWVKCVVKGHIREIVSSQIDLVSKVLRNGTEEKFEGYDFKSGDDMYLYFKSPANGHLAVYLIDEVAQTAYCLLPYSKSEDTSQQISHDKAYVFFSAKDAPKGQRQVVDEMTMICNADVERNDMYIIFSPNTFAKANSNDAVGNLPRQLSWKDFNVWLAKARKRDKDMTVEKKMITIKK